MTRYLLALAIGVAIGRHLAHRPGPTTTPVDDDPYDDVTADVDDEFVPVNRSHGYVPSVP